MKLKIKDYCMLYLDALRIRQIGHQPQMTSMLVWHRASEMGFLHETVVWTSIDGERLKRRGGSEVEAAAGAGGCGAAGWPAGEVSPEEQRRFVDPGAYQRRIPTLWGALVGLGAVAKVVVPSNLRQGLNTFLLLPAVSVQGRQGAPPPRPPATSAPDPPRRTSALSAVTAVKRSGGSRRGLTLRLYPATRQFAMHGSHPGGLRQPPLTQGAVIADPLAALGKVSQQAGAQTCIT